MLMMDKVVHLGCLANQRKAGSHQNKCLFKKCRNILLKAREDVHNNFKSKLFPIMSDT